MVDVICEISLEEQQGNVAIPSLQLYRESPPNADHKPLSVAFASTWCEFVLDSMLLPGGCVVFVHIGLSLVVACWLGSHTLYQWEDSPLGQTLAGMVFHP